MNLKNMLLSIAFVCVFGLGWFCRPLTETPVNAQALTTKSDLISLFRNDATNLLRVRANVKAHRASFDALALTFTDADFTGSNEGITAAQFTTAVTNLTDIFDKFDLGGTLPVGLPTGINRIANVNITNSSPVSGVSQAISIGSNER